MKKRLFGKQLFIVGSILTVAFACQPKKTNGPSSQQSNTNQYGQHKDDDDDEGDDGTYGDDDTSASCEEDFSFYLDGEEISVGNPDIRGNEEEERDHIFLSSEDFVVEITNSASFEEQEKSLTQQITILESVDPVEIIVEHQVQQMEE